jgi:hypothetical protein
MDESSPQAYQRLVDAFCREAAEDFRRAAQSDEEERLACCRYFKRGEIADLSRPELIDFLGISSPSILKMAGYSDEHAQRVMEMLANISTAEIERTAV